MTGTELLLENANATIAEFMEKVREKDVEIARLRAIIEKLPKTEDDWFHRGFAVACAAVARDHDMPSVASDIMRISGITMEELKAAGVDATDLQILEAAEAAKVGE